MIENARVSTNYMVLPVNVFRVVHEDTFYFGIEMDRKDDELGSVSDQLELLGLS